MNPFDLPPILYQIALALELIGWVALLAFPWQRWANFWLAGVAIPQTLALFYIYSLITFWFLPRHGSFRDFLTLEGVYRLFDNQGLLFVAVLNIIAMTLAAGAWMTRKAAQSGMPRFLLTICLVATVVFPGIGFLLFAIVASIRGRWALISNVEQVPAVESQPVAAIVAGLPQVAK
ncbi:MAG TPA: abscisic acid-deficient protein Aba4 family protein [Thermoanaerobaculia bacterium]|nr:abscisic acid-deficient protein Aba4 family protein [Thermoanaerobaculia bacterium]